MQSQQELINEMRTMLGQNTLDDHEAIRLLLASQTAILANQMEIARRVGALEAMHAEFPSLLWLIQHRPRRVAAAIFFVFLLLYILFAPITISDLRNMILEWIGLG